PPRRSARSTLVPCTTLFRSWRERGVSNGAWNTRSIEHVRRQWSRFTATMHHDTQPRRIEPDWQPDSSCFDVLRLAEIDEDFARRDRKSTRLNSSHVKISYAV